MVPGLCRWYLGISPAVSIGLVPMFPIKCGNHTPLPWYPILECEYQHFYQGLQIYQVSHISQETPAFWSHLPLTRRIIKISRVSSIKFDQLILTKMVKIVATRYHILRLKCPKFDFGWGSAPDPAGRAQIQYSPRPPSLIYGSYL